MGNDRQQTGYGTYMTYKTHRSHSLLRVVEAEVEVSAIRPSARRGAAAQLCNEAGVNARIPGVQRRAVRPEMEVPGCRVHEARIGVFVVGAFDARGSIGARRDHEIEVAVVSQIAARLRIDADVPVDIRSARI